MHSKVLILSYKTVIVYDMRKWKGNCFLFYVLCVAWVKLKLASQSQDSVSDSNEKNQRRIEEIKAELLLSARKSALVKVQNRQTSCSGENT